MQDDPEAAALARGVKLRRCLGAETNFLTSVILARALGVAATAIDDLRRDREFLSVSRDPDLGPARAYAWSSFLVLLLDAPTAAVSSSAEKAAAAAPGQHEESRPVPLLPAWRWTAAWERAVQLVSASLIGVVFR